MQAAISQYGAELQMLNSGRAFLAGEHFAPECNKTCKTFVLSEFHISEIGFWDLLRMDFVLQIFHELKLERGGCFASNLHPAAGSRCHDPDGTPGCTYAVRYAGQAWIVGFG